MTRGSLQATVYPSPSIDRPIRRIMTLPHWILISLAIIRVKAMENDYEDCSDDDYEVPHSPTFANQSYWTMNHEQLLHRDLLERYSITGKTARPVKSHQDAVNVYFGLRLIQVDLDERLQTMSTSAWIRITWTDEILTWDPKEYGNITRTRLPHDKVWLPDIGHVNSRHSQFSYDMVDIRVSYRGSVFWYIQGDFQSGCLIDLTEYPFDKHTCDLWFLSHSNAWNELKLLPYPKSPLDLTTYLSAFRDSQQWQIVGNKTEGFSHSKNINVMLKYSRRPALRFTLTLQRKASFYAFLLLVPSMCLGALTVMVYAIPADRPDRTGLAMSLFSSLLLLLLLVVGISPPTANAVPKIAHYYALNLVLIIASLITSALVSMLMKRATYSIPFPHSLQLFCKVAARPLFLQPEACCVFEGATDINVDHKATEEYVQRKLLFRASMGWRLLSRMLDRFCMICHTVLILVCYAVLFPGRSL